MKYEYNDVTVSIGSDSSTNTLGFKTCPTNKILF